MPPHRAQGLGLGVLGLVFGFRGFGFGGLGFGRARVWCLGFIRLEGLRVQGSTSSRGLGFGPRSLLATGICV